MTILLTTAVIAVALFAWTCLFWVIPNALLSLFRYKLWRERDELATEIRNGAYKHEDQPREVVRRIECYIRMAPQLSPLHIGLLKASTIGVNIEMRDEIDFSEMVSEERARLEARIHRHYKLVGDHVLLETPSGWFAIIFGLPIGLCILLYRRLRRNGNGGTLSDGARRRAAVGSSALVNRGRRNGDLMSQYV